MCSGCLVAELPHSDGAGRKAPGASCDGAAWICLQWSRARPTRLRVDGARTTRTAFGVDTCLLVSEELGASCESGLQDINDPVAV